MPSTTPPAFPRYATRPNSSHYAPAITQIGAIATHSLAHLRSHQPAAIYDTTSDLQHQGHAPTEQFLPSSSLAFPGPAQQAVLSTALYLSQMSRHPAWVYPNLTLAQWHSSRSPADPHTTAATTFSTQRIAHKVWLLECKHCHTFLTNRGMKVRSVRQFVHFLSFAAAPSLSVIL
jgi:hypothetical protein